MKIAGLDHITINVTDLQKSAEFYKIGLGLKETGFIDMGDHTLTYFELPQKVRLELIDYAEKTAKRDGKETDPGIYRHFCLETDNLEELAKICLERGISVRKSPSYVEKLACSTMLIVDPNGVEIEIIQKQEMSYELSNGN
mgnify:CR=1 FL=1